ARAKYRARDYLGCVEDMERVRGRWGREEYWNHLDRCLRYGEQYERASKLWADRAKKSSSASRAKSDRWRAVNRAVLGGHYELAASRLEEYGAVSKRGRYADDGAWLSAWIPYRRGLYEEAEMRFRDYLRRKKGERKPAAKYFLAKVMLLQRVETKRTDAIALLRELEARGNASMVSHGIMGGFPGYYGLLAAALLETHGVETSSAPALHAVPHSSPFLHYPSARAALASRSEATREVLPGLARCEWLLAAGYLEEAQQAFRVEVNRYLNGRKIIKGWKLRVPRSETLARGLSWKAEWEYPKPRPTREQLAKLREDGVAEEIRVELVALAHLLNEPHWYAKLLSSKKYPYRSRAYLRAFREHVEPAALKKGIDPKVYWSLMYTESRFNPFVVSYVGATGLMQVYPPALRRRLRERGLFEGIIDIDKLFDVRTNVQASLMWGEESMKRFMGNLALVYGSYNGGVHNVSRWLRAKHIDGRLALDDFIEEIEFRETRNYVRRVISVYASYHLIYEGTLPTFDNDLTEIFESGEFKVERTSVEDP
ncbi:MAG: transglycosylase SLT domain-containing protein, partial [Nannocystaceae bacterium]